MANTWEEVDVAQTENRRELCLHGQEISKRIEKNGLDDRIYRLKSLNYLDISQTSLKELKTEVGELVNLTSLVLCNNQLTSIPTSIGDLAALKILNLSNNQIESVPAEICALTELESMNLSMNKLSSLPAVDGMKHLHLLNISHNQIDSLPDGIFNSSLVHLSHITAGNNQIEELSADVTDLPHLNLLDLSNNKLHDVPPELCECPRLKELNLKGNKFKDRRFGKLVEQCQAKSILDYLANIMKKEAEKAGGAKGKVDKKKKKKKKGGKDEDAEVEEIRDAISVLHFPREAGVVVEVTPAVMAVRPYIVCCIVRNLDLKKSLNMFKNFINLQTKMHDTICQKRQMATIATHDLKSVKHKLTYDAMFPQLLMIMPLFKQKEVSGEKLVENLRKEADEIRKEKKRNTFSGVHKYLDLLQDKTQYPCLVDRDGQVISFPPITNSEKTKISKDSTDILIEVTSSTSLDICKTVMDELLLKMLEIGVGADRSQGSSPEGAAGGAMATGGGDGEEEDTTVSGNKRLVVEQVKVVDKEESLRVIYPSRTDLKYSHIEVIRHFDS